MVYVSVFEDGNGAIYAIRDCVGVSAASEEADFSTFRGVISSFFDGNAFFNLGWMFIIEPTRYQNFASEFPLVFKNWSIDIFKKGHFKKSDQEGSFIFDDQ